MRPVGPHNSSPTEKLFFSVYQLLVCSQDRWKCSLSAENCANFLEEVGLETRNNRLHRDNLDEPVTDFFQYSPNQSLSMVSCCYFRAALPSGE